MNRKSKMAGGWLLALGMALGLTIEVRVAQAQGRPRERAMRSLRAPAEAEQTPVETEQAPVEQVAWSRPQTRTARTQRPWVDPAQRAQMQRSGHAGMMSMQQGEFVDSGRMNAEIIQTPEHSGPIVEHGPAPVVDGFHTGDPMGGYGCTNGDCGCNQGGDCACDSCGDGGCCNGSCDSCVAPGRKVCFCIDLCWFRNLELIGGVHAFQSPGFPLNTFNGNGNNIGGNGNFGFQEGLNLGAALPCIGNDLGIGFQVGFQGTQSNLYESGPTMFLKQRFFTAGLFHRALCGLQGGIVWDHMYNEYMRIPSYEYSQVRGEISYTGPHQNEIGFMCNLGTSGTTVANNPFVGQFNTYVSDFYGGFFRRRSCTGGDFRAFVGATQSGVPFDPNRNPDTSGRLVIGADFHVPLGYRVALNSGFTYLMPLRNSPGGEGWNIGMNLVFYPFKSRCCPKDPCWGEQTPFRPLFNVADNGSFFVRQ